MLMLACMIGAVDVWQPAAVNGSPGMVSSENAWTTSLVGEAALQLRVLIDRSIAEFFVAGGRAVYTTRHYPAAGSGAVTVGASADAAGSSSRAAWRGLCSSVMSAQLHRGTPLGQSPSGRGGGASNANCAGQQQQDARRERRCRRSNI